MFRRYPRKLWICLLLVGVLVICASIDSRLATGKDAYGAAGRGLDDFGEALKLLTTSYFKWLDAEELTSQAIQGMLEELDPYTQFLDRRSLEQLQIDTRGKFGGLGITISTRGGDVPVVMSVLKGTPADTAGLVVGDRIVGINGEPTSGKTLQEVVDVLRGDPNTSVTITIDRPGRPAPFEQPIVRARIGIKSVRIAEVVEPGIGYVSMMGLLGSRFSETTPEELERAIESLKGEDVHALILDLRGNPGGLLQQAVAVADKFLGPDRLVVTTRGRNKSQNREYRTKEQMLAEELSLVVLVNGHSASASEIVAGAIQDSDRGLILGTTTFGKGSVQTVRKIGEDQALKLTTALYYTPSGRSIHKTSKQAQRSGGPILLVGAKTLPVHHLVGMIGQAQDREDALAELAERFDLEVGEAEQVFETSFSQIVGLGLRMNDNQPAGSDPVEQFKTAGGRTVYGGGGITPDVKVEQQQRPRLVIAIARAGLFFDFAVQYAATYSFPERPDAFAVDDEVIQAFRDFLADSSSTGGFEHRTPTETHLNALRESLEEADGPEAAREWHEPLGQIVEREREAEFQKADPYLRLEIGREIGNRVWGARGLLLATLKGDKQYQEAVRILRDPDLYQEKMKVALASGSPAVVGGR